VCWRDGKRGGSKSYQKAVLPARDGHHGERRGDRDPAAGNSGCTGDPLRLAMECLPGGVQLATELGHSAP
jgi:hypothetical protein